MRFRLRYMQHDLELPDGEFVVGRNASCQLSLDDPLVSRRHARFLVGEGVAIEDLQSRNGVLVNGQRIHGKTALQVGDRILIGTQELALLVAHESARRPGAAESDHAQGGGGRGRPRDAAAAPNGDVRQRTRVVGL